MGHFISILIVSQRSCAILLFMAICVVSQESALAQGFLIEQTVSEPKQIAPAITLTPVQNESEQAPSTPSTPSAVGPDSVWRQTATHKDWSILCRVIKEEYSEQGKICKLQPVVNALSKDKPSSQLFVLTIERVNVTKQKRRVPLAPVAIIKTPMDILLALGLSLKVDKARPLRLAIRSCHVDEPNVTQAATGACLAPFQLNHQIENSLMRGNQLTITGKNLAGQTVQTQISLSGFTKIMTMFKEHPSN